ncbi:MAG TPA: alkaline phosphatase D family protein [Micromonosporaceae bacterium]
MHQELLLGPVLRRVDGDQATVWVQSARPATVEVRAGSATGAARTFRAFGCHYALVVVDGLPPGAATPYQVLLDGEVAWPPPGYPFPAPVIRTVAPEHAVRLVFGSCREASPYALRHYPPDALDAFAVRLADRVRTGRAVAEDWPDLLVLLGDQIYADEPSPDTRSWLRRRRPFRRCRAPGDQVVDFTEYTRLYLESWTDPEIRWLLSTVPSVMIFDDHEIIDDWNTSQSWRTDMARRSWWSERISAGLASYWVYQHMGNLSPAALVTDPVYAAVTAAPGGDATGTLRAFGASADADRESYRWSYALDLGPARLVVLDNRCARQLGGTPTSLGGPPASSRGPATHGGRTSLPGPAAHGGRASPPGPATHGGRAMLPGTEWEWFVDTVRKGGYEHLVIGASLPWLLPPAVHHVESWNERLCDSPSRAAAALGERLRRWWDLEHWAAFTESFDEMGALLRHLGEGGAGIDPPASINVISGDVHHSYVARAVLGPDVATPVHQLTCSPVHNRVPLPMRLFFQAGWGGWASAVARALARTTGAGRPTVGWNKIVGPYFGNAIGRLVLTRRSATVTIEGTTPDGTLYPVAHTDLT